MIRIQYREPESQRKIDIDNLIKTISSEVTHDGRENEQCISLSSHSLKRSWSAEDIEKTLVKQKTKTQSTGEDFFE